MTIIFDDPSEQAFHSCFPGFKGGARALRFIIVMLGVNSDTYQNIDHEIISIIGKRLLLGVDHENIKAINAINKYLNQSKVDIKVFEFIDNSRFQSWLIEREINNIFNNLNSDPAVVSSLNSLSFSIKDKFIFVIDYLDFTSEEKAMHLQQISANFSDIKFRIKYLDWFEDDNEKVVAADDYLNKNKQFVFNFSRISDVEDIRIYFYKNIEKKDHLELTFKNIKSLYHNRKFRKNKNVKQCNFSLSISADNNIGKLAKEHKLSRSDVVDLFFRDVKNLRNIGRTKNIFDSPPNSTDE